MSAFFMIDDGHIGRLVLHNRQVRLMRKFNVIGLITALFLLTSCGGAGSHITVAGSTSVQPYAEILAEEYRFIVPEKVIDVQGGGSSAGIRAVRAGTAQIGMSSRALGEAERDLWNVEIARDGLAIIVHPTNPISGLTLEQVQKIYTGEITEWDIPGEARKIHVVTREEGSGTRDAFNDMVMRGERITSRAIVLNANGSIRQFVATDPNAVGFISLGLVDSAVRALTLDGAAPTQGNVSDGSYPLFRSFLFVTQTEPEGLVKDFIDYVLSPNGQRVLANEGLIPSQARRED
jgi:phosphate transport system substrate-binding protein